MNYAPIKVPWRDSDKLTDSGEFDVDDIGEPDWNETPYANLMLPAGDKDLVMAFADRQRFSDTPFDDFVQGIGIRSMLPPEVPEVRNILCQD